jgi:putative membrane protein
MSLRDQEIKDFLYQRANLTRITLTIFFCVGIFGLASDPTREMFIMLTPVALLLSMGATAAFHQPGNLKKEIIVFFGIYISGFLVEAVGVNTGLIFGNYTYGEGLWIKLLNTPLLIGINWVLLIYSTAVIADRPALPGFIKILTSSLLMLLYDLIMEQVAPVMNMWSFEADSVPVRNYLAWFILAVIFHSILKLTGIKYKNQIAPFVFYIQVSFFLTLTIIFNIAR